MENILKEKFDVSVILPIKSSSAFGFEDYFNKCIESIKNQRVDINELIIVHTNQTNLNEFLDNYDFSGITVVRESWDKEPNYAGQVNIGVRLAKSKWVSLFEFDDEYSTIWFSNVKKYTDIYDNVDAFLPIVVDTDEKGLFAGFTNEATFALNMTSEMFDEDPKTWRQHKKPKHPMILWWIRWYGSYLPYQFRKPLYFCLPCMGSVWSLPAFMWLDLPIIAFPFFALCTCGLNSLIRYNYEI